ncbi:MAG TPA: hypothetical protein DCS66_07570 [Flavobacteriaceae bacterium]|nr:hypothetical protein [Flavobacteriaceae bacterium]HAT64448.1 hypothetical protein [Flavobacteriaceae bacterium]|tara:strand:- start:28366 stop:29418 length:1053 start_codon:yes stop_codon:yes gene_type:complete
MKNKTIYILHKNGAPSHYYGLVHLAKENGWEVKFREFSVVSKLYKGIIKGRFSQVKKQLVNAGFLLVLLFSSNKKIVLGIAPFDSKLGTLLPFLKKHQIYYHTSWTCWDKSFHPKRKNNSEKAFQTWKAFLEHLVQHIFTVTRKSRQSILENYSVSHDKISVVYHSLHPAYETHPSQEKIPNSFIYAGRLDKGKGIEALLAFFSENSKAMLTIVGDGKLETIVKEYSSNYNNIIFKGYVSDKSALKKLFAQHEYLVLNSQKTETWEELFGLIIIEGMSQGTLPIAPMHSGPNEIIDPSFGYLFEEGTISVTLAKLVTEGGFTAEKSQKAREASQQYTTEVISKKWHSILN